MALRTVRGVRQPMPPNSLVGRLSGSGAAQVVSLQDIAGALQSSGLISAPSAPGSAPGGATVVAGSGISVSVSGSAYTVTNTGVTSAVAGTGISVSGSTGAVTFSLGNMAAHTFKGNNTGSTGAPLDLTATQLTAELIAMVGDSGSGGTKGLVPAAPSGSTAAGKFLKADGTFAVPTAALAGLTDVTLASLATRDLLYYDAGASKWKNLAAGRFPKTLGTDGTVLKWQYTGASAWHQVAGCATTSALPACTYSNGTSGIGATLTGNANGAIPAIDGITLHVGDILLVKNQVATLQNGIFSVTQLGDASHPFILTRTSDADQGESDPDGTNFSTGHVWCVIQGTVNAASGPTFWTVIPAGTPSSVGTTGYTFKQIAGAGATTLAGGGTGADLSSAAQGSVPYFGASTAMGALAPGLPGEVLTTHGAGANPTFEFPSLTWKDVCIAVATSALPTCTYNNGTSGTGATLTASANGALAIDAAPLVVGVRVLIAGQASAFQNGIYVITQLGDASHPFILTRAIDFDGNALTGGAVQIGNTVPVSGGTVNATTLWQFSSATAGSFVFGTSTNGWTQIGGGGTSVTVAAGTGISVSGGPAYTVTNSGVTSIVAGTNITISGGTGAVTVNSSVSAQPGLFQPVMSAVPTAATLPFTTWGNQGTSTITDNSVGYTLAGQLASHNDEWRIRYFAVPATPYTYTALMSVTYTGSNIGGALLGWYDGTKLQGLRLINNGGAYQIFVSSFTGLSNLFSANQVGPLVYAMTTLLWARINDDGTNITFSISSDGVNFDTIYTVAKASGALGSSGYSNVAFGVEANSRICYGTILSWKKT